MEMLVQPRSLDSKSARDLTRILVVDDDVRNLDVLESILATPELQLVRAQTADEALLALMHGEFACIILDIQLATINGVELARLIKMRKRSQHIPIIFLTAFFLEESDILEGYGVGAVDYLTKPFSPRILKSKVGVFVDLFRTTRALAAANFALENEVAQRQKAEEALKEANSGLETRVRERTLDFSRANEQLRESEKVARQLAAIVESSDDAIISKTLEGIITSWNSGAERIFGYAAHEIIGQSVNVLIPAERGGEEPGLIQRIVNGQRVEHYETIRRRKDGSLLEVSLTISPIKNAEGQIIGVSKIARDITERRRTEERLRRTHEELLTASRAKDDFLATLSHELRTPLNPVLLVASDAVANPQLPANVRGDFQMILKNVELEARLIDDLLDLTRIARGKISLQKQPLDVHAVLQEAIATVQEEISEKQITLALNLKAAQARILADPVRLKQIFWNLLRNAAKFTPEHGSITVQTQNPPHENALLIQVIDSGIGLTAAEISGLFKVFSQGEHARHEAHLFGGLGLGLAIARKLAEFHGGTILASSKGRGQGATFTVELPLGRNLQKPMELDEIHLPQSPVAQPTSRPAFHLLLVDDHEPTRSSLADLLRRRSFNVSTASTVADAEALAQTHKFDLLISDIGLPDGDGYQLMKSLRQRSKIQGIALTGYGMEQDMARSQEVGFVAHLTKPVRVQSLEEAIHSALGFNG